MNHPLRVYRKTHKLTQADLARLLGTSKVTVCRLETGARDASSDLLQRIFAVTHGEVTPNDLLLGERQDAAA